VDKLNEIKKNEKHKKSKPFWKKIEIILIAMLVIVLSIFFYAEIKIDKGEEMKSNIVILETNKGIIKLEIDTKNAPITSKNFFEYVDEGFYDGLVFHRVIPGFMIQGGGFYKNKTQKETRAPIILESKNGLKNNRGTIAMARTMIPNSATSQFFINLANNDFLNYGVRDEGYAVFGKVIEGMNVVDEIGKVSTKPGDWPQEDVIIIKAYRK